MSYTRPTLAEFSAIFTDFAAVTEAQFDYWIIRAERSIGATFGDDQLHATQLMTAHLLALQGLGDGIDSQRIAKFGGATSVQSDGLSLGWPSNDPKQASGLSSTRYGAELKRLASSITGGPRVTGTGYVPARIRRGVYDGIA